MRPFIFKALHNYFWVILLLFVASATDAQQTQMADYVLFGGDGNCTTGGKGHQENDGCLVEIGNKSKITGGVVGSYQFVKTSGEVTISGSIFSGGKIYLADKNTVGGRLSAGNSASYTGSVLKSGSYSKFLGNIDVNGNIQIDSRSNVMGKVTHPLGTNYSGPTPAGGNVTGVPSLAILPQMPAITTFPKAGSHSVYSTEKISAGAYNKIKLPGNKTITFSGTGEYIFNSIDNYGANTFIFDFKNNSAGVFKLYIYGDVDLDNIQVQTINGGDASRIYAEVHGNGGSCWDKKSAWNMGNSKGFSCKKESVWLGTVWAPYGAINIGSSSGGVTVNGALLSTSKVTIGCYVTINFAPFSSCTPPTVTAGPDTVLNVLQMIKLQGSSATPNVQFTWQAFNGGEIISGANSSMAVVSQTGTYVLTASTQPGCFSKDTVIVKGKGTDLIGPELKSLFLSNDKTSPLSKSIFIIQNDSVFIEVIPMDGKYATVLNMLQSPEYGMTDFISNGDSKRIITGKFPIANLLKLNELADLVNFCRPLYPALTNAGVTQTAGDSAIRTNYVRNSFGIQGEGITIGVLSDSYNTLPGNPAKNDVINGDLPGTGNSENPVPVKILKEFPLGQRSDEGRAMLQIIHDVAPKAQLSFRTGFLSPGDFASGIRELATDGCKVIVDDITFITEPFFTKGSVDNAIADVTANGVVYVTAAGNFGNKSYGSIFNPVNAPAGLTGKAHNFGGGTFLQKVSLKGTESNPGVYTIVLQWVDDIYSLSGSGTINDLDIYLADDAGNPVKGYNRINLGGDPIEVLPFSVTENSVANIMVINTSSNPSPNLRFKYVVFRGDFKINEYTSESSTIVGHSKAPEAITVGAARYSKTPAFGLNVPELESFSSIGGGVLANGIISQKPDLIGPDGVNTTVDFKNIDSEEDGLPNFFGTSAAAPHVAGAAALLLQSSGKFYNELLSPASVQKTFQNTAINMDVPGFDFNTGHGFINADAALRTIANPTPQLDSLGFTDPTLIPGEQPLEMLVYGKYMSPDTRIIFGKDTLPATMRSFTLASVTLPVFYDSKFVSAFTPSITPSGLDGGLSNSLSINGIPKKIITVVADNATKKYGTAMPAFTSTILVNGDPVENTTLTASMLGLSTISYETAANELSDVGIYSILPSRVFDETNPDDQLLLDRYNYTFTKGALNILKLPLKITARDTTLVYGQKAGDFNYNYLLDATANISNPAALLNTVQSEHKNQVAEDVIGLVNGQAVVIINGQAVQIINGQAVQIINGQAVVIVNGQAVQIINGQAVQIINGQAVQIINGQAVQIVNGQAVVIVNSLTESEVDNLSFLTTVSSLEKTRQLNSTAVINGIKVPQKTNVIDITKESVLGFNSNTAVTSLLFSIPNVSARGIVDVESYTNGQAVQIINGQAVQIINGQAVQIINGQAVQIINGEPVPIVGDGNRTAVIINDQDIGTGVNEFKSLNMITGLDAGEQYILPAAFTSNNFDISYAPGKLTILPAPLSIKALDTSKVYGVDLTLDTKNFTIDAGDLMYGDSILSLQLKSEGTGIAASPGIYPIVPGSAILEEGQRLSNYDITYISGKLTVGKAALVIKAKDASRMYWEDNPGFSATFSGFINGETLENAGISGVPSFSTPATYESNVGNYDINISQGTLFSDKYSFSFEKGTLHITPAPLYVKADDKVMYQSNSFPRFTGTITNLKTGSYPKISYSLDPTYSGKAGVYDIVPSIGSFPNAGNYSIQYTNGKLYVNPKCGNAKALKVRLNCVEKVSQGKYIAHFYVINDNATTLYIPAGWNNFVYSFGYFKAIQVPEIFTPGITKFDIPFDGNLINWVVSSYEKCWYIPSLDFGANWSKSCDNNLITSTSEMGRNSLSSGKNQQIATDNNIQKAITNKINPLQNKEEGLLSVYPNPVQNKAIIYLSNEEINVNKAALYDVNGKMHPLKLSRQISPNSFEIDLSDLQKGFYLVKVKVKNGYKSIMIVKG